MYLLPFLFSQSHSWCLFCFWLFSSFLNCSSFFFLPSLKACHFCLCIFSFTDLYISTSLWLALSHLSSLTFPLVPRNLSTFKDLNFLTVSLFFCSCSLSLPLSYSSSLHHALSSLAWPLQWAIVMELSWEFLKVLFRFLHPFEYKKINKDASCCLLYPLLFSGY